jgi:biotin carboxylase
MAHGPTRDAAIERLIDGLSRSELVLRGKLGLKRTNLDLMIQTLGSPTFRSGAYTTHLLEELKTSSTSPG